MTCTKWGNLKQRDWTKSQHRLSKYCDPRDCFTTQDWGPFREAKPNNGLQSYPNSIVSAGLQFLHQKMCLLFYLFPISRLWLYRLKYSLSFLLLYIVRQLSLRIYFPFSRVALSSLARLSKHHPCTELCCNQPRAYCQFINISVSKHQNCFIFLYWMEPEASKSAIELECRAECMLHLKGELSAQRIYRCLPYSGIALPL